MQVMRNQMVDKDERKVSENMAARPAMNSDALWDVIESKSKEEILVLSSYVFLVNLDVGPAGRKGRRGGTTSRVRGPRHGGDHGAESRVAPGNQQGSSQG